MWSAEDLKQKLDFLREFEGFEEFCKHLELFLFVQEAPKDSVPEEKLKEFRRSLEQIGNAFWKLCFLLLQREIRKALKRGERGIDSLDPEERLFLNFGYVGLFGAGLEGKLMSADLRRAPIDPFTYMTFSDYLLDQANALMWGRTENSLEGGLSQSDKIIILKSKIPELFQRLKDFLRNLLPEESALVGLKLADSVSKNLEDHVHLEGRSRKARLADTEGFKELKSRSEAYQRDKSKLINLIESSALGEGERDFLLKMISEAERMMRLYVTIESDLERTKNRFSLLMERIRNKGEIHRMEMLKELVGRKGKMAQMASRRSRQVHMPLLTSASQLVDAVDMWSISSSVNAIVSRDPGIMNLARIRTHGLPRVVVLPGRGNGVYDWEDNTLNIPFQAPQGTLTSVAFALASMRWDADEEGELRFSYQQLKENEGKPIVEIQLNFCKHYHLWVTKEAEGYRVLPKEVQRWFSWKVPR